MQRCPYLYDDMKTDKDIIAELIIKHPELKPEEHNIREALAVMITACRNRHLIMTCGNGGSEADSDHIVGELMKSFRIQRPIPEQLRESLISTDSIKGRKIADSLEMAIPSISLCSQHALMSAFANDVSGEMIYAQQVCGYGKSGDVLIAISTSGNAKNVNYAAVTAKAMGIHTIALTGKTGGGLSEICETVIKAPGSEVYEIQELHLPIYHALCAALEESLFG